MFIAAKTLSHPPSVRRAMFIDANAEPSALRQEGHVYSRQPRAIRPPSGGRCL